MVIWIIKSIHSSLDQMWSKYKRVIWIWKSDLNMKELKAIATQSRKALTKTVIGKIKNKNLCIKWRSKIKWLDTNITSIDTSW